MYKNGGRRAFPPSQDTPMAIYMIAKPSLTVWKYRSATSLCCRCV